MMSKKRLLRLEVEKTVVEMSWALPARSTKPAISTALRSSRRQAELPYAVPCASRTAAVLMVAIHRGSIAVKVLDVSWCSQTKYLAVKAIRSLSMTPSCQLARKAPTGRSANRSVMKDDVASHPRAAKLLRMSRVLSIRDVWWYMLLTEKTSFQRSRIRMNTVRRILHRLALAVLWVPCAVHFATRQNAVSDPAAWPAILAWTAISTQSAPRFGADNKFKMHKILWGCQQRYKMKKESR